jgi:antitoxin ParD1/3/4
MAIRVSKNVSLTPELRAFVDRKVASGQYQTASEVVREALRLLQAQEPRDEYRVRHKDRLRGP